MPDNIKDSLPETKAGLEIFIKECDREITRIERLSKMALSKLGGYETEQMRVRREGRA